MVAAVMLRKEEVYGGGGGVFKPLSWDANEYWTSTLLGVEESLALYP